jgi:hypothetical protein
MKKSNYVYTADNYPAELLGGIALQLLVQVATDGKYISSEMNPALTATTRE